MRGARWAGVLAAAACLGAACRGPAPEAAEAAAASRGGEEVGPAFAGDPRLAHPPVRALCAALHALPAARRAACCGGAAGVDFGPECERLAGLALEAGAVRLGDVERCVQDQAQRLAGCDWVGPSAPEPAPSCRGLVLGALAAGQRCRSSLECSPGLFCAGAGPTAAGTCALPRPAGAACALAVDALAVALAQPLDQHRECQGACRRHRCEPLLAPGAACAVDAQCPAGHRCAGRCVPGERGAAGEGCMPGGCGEGLRCVEGRCAAPLGAGLACTADLQCRGACLAGDGGGRCGPRCGN